MFTYEDIHEKVAESLLKEPVQRDGESCYDYLRDNSDSFGKLAHQLINQFKKWTGKGMHNVTLTVDSLMVVDGNLHVSGWADTELCRHQCEYATCPDAHHVKMTIIDMYCVSRRVGFDETYGDVDVVKRVLSHVPTALSHPPFTSSYPFSTTTDPYIATMVQLLDLPPCGVAFVQDRIQKATASEKECVTNAALLLAHKVYGLASETDVKPSMFHVCTKRRVSVQQLCDMEAKLWSGYGHV